MNFRAEGRYAGLVLAKFTGARLEITDRRHTTLTEHTTLREILCRGDEDLSNQTEFEVLAIHGSFLDTDSYSEGMMPTPSSIAPSR